MFSSPNSQSLGEYGKTSVNFFNGLHQLTIPIFEINENNLSIPISLDYSSGGNIVNANPGWVGLSWNLNAGGIITRQRNGEADECTGGSYSWPVMNGGIEMEEHAYLALGSAVGNNWPDISYDYYFLPLDRNPDEFFFNFNGISGSFYRNELGQWKVKSKQNIYLTVKVDIGSLGEFYSVIKSFTLIDGAGVEYVFGGDQSSVEVPINTTAQSQFLSNYGYFNHPASSTSTVWEAYKFTSFPSAWYLTSIKKPNGKLISFSYQKSGVAISRSLAETNVIFGEYNPQTESVVETTFLKSINADNVKVEFSISKSKSLYHFKSGEGTFLPPESNISYYKLDKINVFDDKNEVLRTINFSYIENTNTRLKLKEISFGASNLPVNKYEFEYNPLPLPDFSSFVMRWPPSPKPPTDHWGYYNGNTSSKEPNSIYAQAEILTSVKYPTGGETKFFYEANSYSQVAKQYPFVLEPKIDIGAGVRIKKIIDYPISGENYVREYFYVKNGFVENGISSGVLSGIPRYHFSQLFLNVHRYENRDVVQNFIVNTPSRTFGRDVTYSRVVEKTKLGYKVFNYSNHDNGFMDEPALEISNPNYGFGSNSKSPNANDMLYLYSSRELSRGNLLSEEYFTNDVVPAIVYAKGYEYNEDLTQFVKAQGNGPNGGLAVGRGYKSTFKHYTYCPYIKKSVETNYTDRGQIIIENKFVYDDHNQLKKSIKIESNGKTAIVEYKYPYDFQFNIGGLTNIYAKMTMLNMVALPIEITKSVLDQITNSEKIIESKLYTYKLVNSSIAREAEYAWHINGSKVSTTINPSGITFDPGYQKRIEYKKYDAWNNILQTQNNQVGIDESYIWGYRSQHLIAKASNCSVEEFAFANFENFLEHMPSSTGHWMAPANWPQIVFTWFINDGFTGEKSFYGPRIFSKTVPQNDYRLSFWQKGVGSLKINGVNHSFSNADWKYTEILLSSITGVAIENPNALLIDDLCLARPNGQITTYTYKPLVGMTSMTDAKGMTIYYEYDSFGRIKLEKDHLNKVVKSYDYYYKQP